MKKNLFFIAIFLCSGCEFDRANQINKADANMIFGCSGFNDAYLHNLNYFNLVIHRVGQHRCKNTQFIDIIKRD
jgi:hypothetical protein